MLEFEQMFIVQLINNLLDIFNVTYVFQNSWKRPVLLSVLKEVERTGGNQFVTEIKMSLLITNVFCRKD